MKPNKFIYGLGSLSTLAIPLSTTISCNDKKDDDGIFTITNIFKSRAKAASSLANGQVTNGNGWTSVLALDGKNHTVRDQSFNQNTYAGLKASNSVVANKNTDHIKPASDNQAGFLGMYSGTADKSLIIAPGFIHIKYLSKGLTSIANKAVILLDGDIKAANIASIVFKSHQSGFLAGYMAGHYLNLNYETFKDGGLKVATFGGLNIPGVTPFMAGFQNGIKYFNKNLETGQRSITFIDNGSKADYFTGTFEAGGAKAMAEKLLSKGADLIFPVAGPQTKDVQTAIIKASSSAKIIGVDVAQELDQSLSKVVFSAIKDLKVATTKMVEVVSGTKTSDEIGYNGFEGFGGLTIGDIDNGLVGVSPGRSGDTNAKAAFDKITQTVKDAAKDPATNPLSFDY